MSEGPDHIAFVIDRFLEAEKTLQGVATWGKSGDPREQRIRWSLLVGDSISEGVLCLTAYPNLRNLKFTIALVCHACVARFDFVPDYEWHDNPTDRGRLLGA